MKLHEIKTLPLFSTIELSRLNENIVDVINMCTFDTAKPGPVGVADMMKALTDANLDKSPTVIKKAIDMLDKIIVYAITLSNGNTTRTVKGIEDVKTKMIAALRQLEK